MSSTARFPCNHVTVALGLALTLRQEDKEEEEEKVGQRKRTLPAAELEPVARPRVYGGSDCLDLRGVWGGQGRWSGRKEAYMTP